MLLLNESANVTLFIVHSEVPTQSHSSVGKVTDLPMLRNARTATAASQV
jgi:hypothetical protein